MCTAKCDPLSPQARGCTILTSKLIITSIFAPVQEFHRDILALLAESMKEHIFNEFIPEIQTISFLGPDPEVVMMYVSQELEVAKPEVRKSSVKTIPIALATFGCLALGLLLLSVCRKRHVLRNDQLEK